MTVSGVKQEAVELPHGKNDVFDAMVKVVPGVKGAQIKKTDKAAGRILGKAGMSLFSWGENITIDLEEIASDQTRVSITSRSKTGLGSHGRNRKNVEAILAATSQELNK